MSTAAIHTVRLIIGAAAMRGVAPPQLLAAIGIEPPQLLDHDGRVPVELALRAWHIAAEMSGDPAFGLMVVDYLRPDSMGALGWAIHASATVGEGLARMARFLRIANQLVTMTLATDDSHARIEIVIEHAIAADEIRHPIECLMSAIVELVRRTTGEPLGPLAVSFRHARPADIAPHVARFGLAPAFAQPRSELVFARRVLDLAHRAPDPGLIAVAERHLRRLIAELPAVDTFSGRVRRVLAEELRHGEPTVARLTARLRVSDRTLHRRLRQETTTVHGLLDEVRSQLARRHLEDDKESLAEISFLLGFSDARAFHRAFKRWTGKTPAAYRDAWRARSMNVAGAASR